VIEISPSHLLEHIAHFYKTNHWKNPHLRENGIEVNQLEELIDYLNLPDDYEEVEDPIEERDEEEDFEAYADFSSENDEDWDPSLRDDRYDDGFIDYGYDPNPYGHT
jgi:hypothetical protein